ncbi:hypothetical protein RM863_39690, partial [Streptomyces sp. DSM 41014]|nr:hypothetical protein [Streptomyces sp. DSM 41014]
MNFHPTSSTTAARLRLGAFVAVPVLAFSVACVGGDDTSGTRGHDQVATVPEGTATAQDKDADKPTASESARPAGKSAFFDAQMTFVQCMRAKGGYKDYPDPKLSGYLDWSKVNEIGEQPGRNEGIKAGKDNVCADELQA